jgi:hypothetical protein
MAPSKRTYTINSASPTSRNPFAPSPPLAALSLRIWNVHPLPHTPYLDVQEVRDG